MVGVDLTAEYVETGNAISAWPGVALRDRVSLVVGDALDLQASLAGPVDRAFMLHVAMNIADKARLAREVHRALKPAGLFGCFDVMKPDGAVLQYPLPFATDAEGCAVASPGAYRRAFGAAGFRLVAETDRREYVLAALTAQRARQEGQRRSGAPVALGPALVMGPRAPEKLSNLLDLFRTGDLTAAEMVWQA